MTTTIRALMFFAADPAGCSSWWAEHFGLGATIYAEPGGFHWFDIGGLELGFHPDDDARNPVGASPVAYFTVEDLDDARVRLLSVGCTAHRGPLAVTPERHICQLIDPFGNTFGLDGP